MIMLRSRPKILVVLAVAVLSVAAVASMSDDREAMIVATLDLSEQRKMRQRYTYFRDRKPLLYGDLVKMN